MAVIKARIPMDWAEQQHLNYLTSVIAEISKAESEENGSEPARKPMSEADMIKSMGPIK